MQKKTFLDISCKEKGNPVSIEYNSDIWNAQWGGVLMYMMTVGQYLEWYKKGNTGSGSEESSSCRIVMTTIHECL